VNIYELSHAVTAVKYRPLWYYFLTSVNIHELGSDSTRTVTATVPGWNGVASVWSWNIFFRSRTMQSIFARYIEYNIDSIDQHCLLFKVYKHLYNFRLT